MRRSRAHRARIIAGGIELERDDGSPIVFPRDYVLVTDPDGKLLDKCSLLIGPAQLTDKRIPNTDNFDRQWFGDDFDLRLAVIDVPDEGWQHCCRVTEILYFRPGQHEGDWKHKFSEPQPLYQSGAWHMLLMPTDCVVSYRGIVRP